MYSKPTLQRSGNFRDLTQLGCFGSSDLTVPGIGATDGNIPEIIKGADGRKTTKICVSAISGF